MKQYLLLVLSISALCFAQPKKLEWKEITYPADGFAITVPYAGLPHLDAQLPDTNTYPVYLLDQQDIQIVLRVKHKVSDCNGVLNELKTRITQVRSQDSGIEKESIKELINDGHHGVEYRWRPNSSTVAFERNYCGNDSRLYVFSAMWPKTMGFPDSVQRILNSFRLLKSNEQQQSIRNPK